MRVRRRKNAGAAPTAEADRFAADRVAKSAALPYVLTPEAVAAGHLPEPGDPGMAPTLAASVPVPFRFWKLDDRERARDVRDALVEAEIFTSDAIALVNGEPHRLVTKRFLAEVDETDAEPVTKADHATIAASFYAGEVEVVDCTSAVVVPGGEHWVAITTEALASEVAKALGGVAFHVTTRPGVVFVGKDAPRASKLVEPYETRSETLAKSALGRARFRKADGEERYVFGIVLEPETVDSQGDIYSAEEVRAAAHRFLENYAQIGLQHEEIVTGKVKILESYVAPVDFDAGGQTVKAGTWLLGVRAVDDGIWQAVKDGSYTGFSIGGTAVRTEDPGALA